MLLGGPWLYVFANRHYLGLSLVRPIIVNLVYLQLMAHQDWPNVELKEGPPVLRILVSHDQCNLGIY